MVNVLNYSVKNVTCRLVIGYIQGYILYFLFLLKNINCGYSLEPSRRDGSNEYPEFMF